MWSRIRRAKRCCGLSFHQGATGGRTDAAESATGVRERISGPRRSLGYQSGGDKIALILALPPGLPWRSWCHLRVRPLDAPPVPCQQKLFERLTTRSASSVKLARYIDQGEGGGVPCKLRFCAISNNFSRFSPVVESCDHMLDNRGSNPIGDFLLQT